MNTKHENTNGIFLPIVSDIRPYSGWNDVDVSMKDVDSQEAAFEELNADVIDVCVEAIIVESAAAT